MYQITPIVKNSTDQEICASVVDYIISNQLSAGDMLPNERDFASHLNVSRSSLRLALKRLSEANLVKTVHGKGTMFCGSLNEMRNLMSGLNISISIPNNLKFKHLIEVRSICESAFTAIAASRAGDEDIASLVESFDMLSYHLEKNDAMAYQVEDINFHKRVARAAKNPFLSEISNYYLTAMIDVKSTVERAATAHEHHRQILEAIKDHDPVRAEEIASVHVAFCRGNAEYEL